MAGKLDWLAAGLPYEGEFEGWPTAGSVARTDVPTCGLDERVGEVRDRTRGAGWDACVVVNAERVVLGLLRPKELDGPADRTAEQLAGPATFRPHVPAQEMAEFMVEHDLPRARVTTSEGRLVGLLLREDVERSALEFHRSRHHHQEDDDDATD